MSSGTPLVPKCPRCHRGKYGHPRRINGTRATGRFERLFRRSQHSGSGKGGSGFYGHRGEVECLDCGYKWYSTHPDSGRVKCRPSRETPCPHGGEL